MLAERPGTHQPLQNNPQCYHFQQFYNRHSVKVHVPIIRWSHSETLTPAKEVFASASSWFNAAISRSAPSSP